eukprot:2644211-Pyramimonas_sp.AAC.1
MDLSKAYDNVDHYVAVAALQAEKAPAALINVCLCAWKGPRACVHNELSSPLWVAKGLPQGDSCAPGALVATLTPWRAEPARGWACMDDRSLTAGGARAEQDFAE